jgi:hypothetical protein
MSWIDLRPEEKRVIMQRCADVCPDLVERLAIKAADEVVDKLFVEEAKEQYGFGSDGDVEIDDNAVVSRGEDGAYVMGWVYVRNEEAGACTECGAFPGTPEYGTVGDGCDNMCGNCADKLEADNE